MTLCLWRRKAISCCEPQRLYPHWDDRQAATNRDFTCSAADSCIAEAAARCTQLGPSDCQSFSYDPIWNPLAAELFSGGLATASHNPAWTLYVKTAVKGSSGYIAPRANRTDPPFALNQNYVLFRYLQLIQGNGSTAIHFNGGIIDWGASGDPGSHRMSTTTAAGLPAVGRWILVAKRQNGVLPQSCRQ